MRKKGDVHATVGIRIDIAPTETTRAAVARACTSSFLQLTSWIGRPEAGRAYALATGSADDAARFARAGLRAASLPGEATTPPRVALGIRPEGTRATERLAAFFLGAGAPAGVTDVALAPGQILVEFDDRRTSTFTVLAAVDAVVGRASRTIDFLRPLGDASLAAIAAQSLNIPDLTERRIVEYHLERLAATPSVPVTGG